MARLLEKYRNEIIPELVGKFNYKNKLQAPRVEKIILNVGMGKALEDIKYLNAAVDELTVITGQKAVLTRAKKAISGFKIRIGLPIGCKVTLRGKIMYEFLDRMVNVALPRIRDFKGVSPKSFDGRGNYTLGVTEQVIFPEVSYEKVQSTHGIDITIVTTAKSDNEARGLLQALGIPFAKQGLKGD